MTMKIDPEDPRAHFEARTYARAIVPGTLPDITLRDMSRVFRPDSMKFGVTRKYSAGQQGLWKANRRVLLAGYRVLKSGQLNTLKVECTYDLQEGPYATLAPQDVIDYVNAIVKSLNAEG